MHVTKVVDHFAKIPEQLSLNFYDFSTIFKRIYKFCCFSKQKKKETELCSWAPGSLKQIAGRPLAGAGTEEVAGGRNPSEELTGGEG